jgi:hypothetical protein
MHTYRDVLNLGESVSAVEFTETLGHLKQTWGEGPGSRDPANLSGSMGDTMQGSHDKSPSRQWEVDKYL